MKNRNQTSFQIIYVFIHYKSPKLRKKQIEAIYKHNHPEFEICFVKRRWK